MEYTSYQEYKTIKDFIKYHNYKESDFLSNVDFLSEIIDETENKIFTYLNYSNMILSYQQGMVFEVTPSYNLNGESEVIPYKIALTMLLNQKNKL